MKLTHALPVLLLGMLPATAFAQFEDKSYDELMQIGLRLYNEGKVNTINYKSALRAFEAARQLNPSAAIVTYNIARTQHHLGNCEQALNDYLWYQSNAMLDVDYNDVSVYIDELSKQCGSKGTITLQCFPGNAVVSIDGERPVSCSGTHRLKSGVRELKISAEGYETIKSTLDVSENTYETHEFSLQMTRTRMQMLSREEILDNKVFWGGVTVASLGTVATVVGGTLMGTAYEKDANIFEYYVKNENVFYGGLGTLIAGGLAMTAGVWMIVDSLVSTYRKDKQRVKNYQEIFTVTPTFGISSEGASAALQFSF